MACINIRNPEYIALSNSLSKYGLTNQGIIQAYIHEYQEETNSDNYPDISYFSNEFITVQGDIATEEPSLFIYKGDNLVGHVKLENTGDQLIEREVNVYTPGRGIGSFAYSKIAEMAQAQGFQFRSDEGHSEAGTNLWEGLVKQDKAEKLNNVYYYKQQENKQKNQEQLSVVDQSDITTNFEQYFPDYSYLSEDERQVFIKGIESGDITITCTRGTIKAESGMVFGNKLGSKWELVKDLKGYKSHEYGGVDLEVGKGSINIKRGKSSIEARHGLLIYK